MYLSKQRSFKESGYVLVMSLFVLLLLLSLSMAAIDVGNLFMWRLRLERAAKAGVAAGLGHRALLGYTESASAETDVENLMRRVVGQNLGLPNNQDSAANGRIINYQATPNYIPDVDQASIVADIHVNTFLLGALNKIKPFNLEFFCPRDANTPVGYCKVGTTQTAQLDPANVVLVLDTSGSMQCEVNTRPGQTDPCACRTMAGTVCGADNNPTRIGELKAAVRTFQRHFNPARDRIAIVPFNLGAATSFPFLDGNNRPRAFGGDAAFTDVVDGLQPIGNTNPCDGLIEASGQIRLLRDALPANERRRFRPFVVFFTDGAPNALRGSFTQDAEFPTRLTDASDAPNADWYQYSIEWINAGGGTYRTPSPLFLRKAQSLFNFELNDAGLPIRYSDGLALNFSCADIPASRAGCRCGEVAWDTTNLTYLNSLEGSPTSAGCLQSLDFDLPNMPNYGVRGVQFSDAGKTISYTNQLPYYCTVEAADYLRQQLQAAIFVVGLGNAPDACMKDDPLQDADNSFLRKDNFLARVALDEVRVRSPNADPCAFYGANNFARQPRAIPATADGGAACPHSQRGMEIEVGFTPPDDNRDLNDFNRNVAGLYIPIDADNAQRLPTAFSRIAKQILLRLAS